MDIKGFEFQTSLNLKRLIGSVFVIMMLGCSSDLFETKKPPEINRLEASSYEVNPGDTVRVTVEIENSDETLNYQWLKDGGTFIPPEDRSYIDWIAPAEGGSYHIAVTVSNEEKSSDKEITITVRSLENPLTEIISPKKGEFVVQYNDIVINASAQHDNGIQQVRLYINDILRNNLGGHSSEFYQFTYRLSEAEPSGDLEIKVIATANVTGSEGRDSVTVIVEGIILGKE